MNKEDSIIKNAITTLVCPLCRGGLFFAKIVKSQGKVQRASIQCKKCGNSFRVIARIPILLPPGRFADWTHPTVDLLFGNVRRSLEELIQEYGVERIKEMYFALMRG